MSVALFAQQLVPPMPGHGVLNNSGKKLYEATAKTPTDTLGWTPTSIPCFGSPTPNIYQLGMADSLGNHCGYWFGVNYDNSVADPYALDYYAMGYVVSDNIGIEGIIAMIGGKHVLVGGASSYLELMIYELAADQALTAASTTGLGPDAYQGSPLATVNLLTDNIDTTWATVAGMNYVALPSVIPMNTDFAVVANFGPMRLATDTAYMLCDEPGNHGGLNYSFCCIDPSVYYWLTVNYATSGSYDVNISLFAVIDANYVGINDEGYFQGMKLTTSPNPASDMLNVEYALQYNGNVKAQILNGNGQLVREVSFGQQTMGDYYKQTINISDLASGTYFLSLMNNGNRLTKKFIVE